MTDAIDLAAVTIRKSPVDLASWPATVAITGVTMDPRGGIALAFDRPLPDAWKWRSNPDKPDDNIQYTVWFIVRRPGTWLAAAFVAMWQGRRMDDGSIPPLLTGYPVLWGSQASGLMNVFDDYVPHELDPIGIVVSAGNARLEHGPTSVRERSNVVLVRLPANDTGDFRFDSTPSSSSPPLPAPVPAPSLSRDPAPSPWDAPPEWVLALMEDVHRVAIDLEQLSANLSALGGRIDALRATGIKVRV